MKRTLFAITAALLLTLPAACMHAHHGRPGGPGGPGRHGCCCKCPQHQGGAQPDCPKPDCPSRPDCPKAQQAPAPSAK